MNKERQTVEIVQAWAWRCPSCGMENFCHSEILEGLSLEEKREAIAENEGIQPEDVAIPDEVLERTNLTTSPELVRCSNCESEFTAKTREEVDLVTEEPWEVVESSAETP